MGGAEGAALGRPDLRHLGATEHPHRRCPQPLRAGDRGGLGGRAGRRLAPPRPLLHALGQRLQQPDRHRRRRPAGPLPRRLAADRAADGGATGPRASAARLAGAADRARRRRRRRPRRRRQRGFCEGAGAARDRRRPSHDRRPHRLRPAAAGAARPADPADAAGERDQDDGDLRRALLAGRGTLGTGDERPRPGPGDLRQLAARRQPRRPARVPRGSLRPPLGDAAGGGAARGDPRRPRAPVRAAGGAAGRLRRAGLGRRGVDARLLRLPDDDRRLDRIRPRPARAGRPPALGRGRDRHRLERLHGRPSAPANAPPPRPSVRFGRRPPARLCP